MQKQLALSKFKISLLVLAVILFASIAVVFGGLGGTSAEAYADSVQVIITDYTATYNTAEVNYPTDEIYIYGSTEDAVVTYYEETDTALTTPISAPIHAGTYIVKAECESAYDTAYLTIEPCAVTVELSGSYDPVYSGLAYEKTVTRSAVYQSDIENNTFELVVKYVKDGTTELLDSAVDVGLYNISISLYNPSTGEECTDYQLTSVSGGTSINIVAKDLQIGVKSVSVDYGGTPEFTFTYSGFVAGEDESVLIIKPTVSSVPTESGVYSIYASGASASNYAITYTSGTLTINTNSLTVSCTGMDDILLTGSFDPTASVVAVDMTEDSAYSSTVYSILSIHNQVNFESEILKIISIDSGDANQGSYVTYVISGVDTDWFFKTKVGIYDTNGDFQTVSVYSVNDGTITFTTNTLGNVVIYQNTTPTYIAVGCALLLVLIVVIYLTTTSYTYNKRKKQANKPPKKVVTPKKVYEW